MSNFTKITEQSSKYNDLEKMSVEEILFNINQEDITVPHAVNKCLPQIKLLVEQIFPKMEQGGRLFYIGAGTSGRLGILDASECPPTFGVNFNTVIGIIAGGDTAIRKAVENAEDNPQQGWLDLQNQQINPLDTVIGIAASGTTPYVIEALKMCNQNQILTGCITCNLGSPLAQNSQFPIECVVGPEFLTGSSRMKAGTAQKLILNMISTSLMIKLGKVKGNKMVDMQMSNKKLIERAEKMVIESTQCSSYIAKKLIAKYKSARLAIQAYQNGEV
jgi:N-acetylmuramic acid 6-phosphate etherase